MNVLEHNSADNNLGQVTWLLTVQMYQQRGSTGSPTHFHEKSVVCMLHSTAFMHYNAMPTDKRKPSIDPSKRIADLIDWAVDEVVTCVPHESPMSHFSRS